MAGQPVGVLYMCHNDLESRLALYLDSRRQQSTKEFTVGDCADAKFR